MSQTLDPGPPAFVANRPHPPLLGRSGGILDVDHLWLATKRTVVMSTRGSEMGQPPEGHRRELLL